MDTAIVIGILGLIETVALGWFGYNQKNHERKLDAKLKQEAENIECKRKDEILALDRENSRRRRHSAIVYGELGELRSDFDADRVYIAQPHPMGDIEKVSIYYEVKRKGIERMRNHIQQLALADIPIFAKELADKDWIHIHNIDEVRDDVAHTMMHVAGTKQLFITRLLDVNDDWCGSLFVEYTRKHKVDERRVKHAMEELGKSIHLILPEYKE